MQGMLLWFNFLGGGAVALTVPDTEGMEYHLPSQSFEYKIPKGGSFEYRIPSQSFEYKVRDE